MTQLRHRSSQIVVSDNVEGELEMTARLVAFRQGSNGFSGEGRNMRLDLSFTPVGVGQEHSRAEGSSRSSPME
jgi:hypothetical protein